MKKKSEQDFKIWLIENIKSLGIAILIVVLIRSFIVQAYRIPSGSMESTLLIGDFLLVTRFNYGMKIPFTDVYILRWSKPKRGEVIVFRFPRSHSKNFIKRVIGVEGDRVEIKGKKVYVNGEEINEPYVQYIDPFIFSPDDRNPGRQFFCPQGVQRCNRDYYGPIIVPKHKLFVMGDNRDNSNDSRYWGFVDIDEVQGRAWRIYFSWNGSSSNILKKVRWKRIGMRIR